ncbi:shikimate dehydrogenase [Paenibacillus glufosinatiresistens]|uniref:shikimate dehydrogenase n=1 Tax=Paenibacillus glufosinatiresistens TaxID=3070657 RepID=UPI00286E19B5|nr:shikimate dehydrogenase [Paenibacillus sp. YX.27]
MNAEAIAPKAEGYLLLGVIGCPVAQSKSPLMHGAALKEMGLEGSYVPLHVEPERLGETIAAMRTLGFRGFNVTIPHKLAIMDYLDDVDERAREIGAVNTVLNEGGRLKGYNTDGIGYVRSLKAEAAPELAGKRAVVIGAGGAARGIVDALLRENPASVTIVNRDATKAASLADAMASRGRVAALGTDKLQEAASAADILINTTSVGMYPQESATPIPAEWIPGGIVVSDLIYNPLETRMLREAAQRGCTVHGGLGMFVYQGAYALEYWTGRPAPAGVMREALLRNFG